MDKTFDAVAWMRRRRAEIDAEDERLSWDEKSRKTLESLQDDPRWQRVKHPLVQTAPVSPPSR
jgi:hypothetical protein